MLLQTPSTHSCPSAQRLKQLPQWRSFLCRFTHLPLQQVWVERQRLEQLPQWRSLVRRFTHLSPQRVCPSEHRSSSAQATPGTEANAAPRRAPPTNLSALPLERVPFASPLASSSKEVAIEEPPEWELGEEEYWTTSWLMWCCCCSGLGPYSSPFPQRCNLCSLD